MSLRERKKEEQRKRILEACGDLFRNRGFDETTVDDILEAVDISRQTFFNYFPSKQAVLTELGFEWMADQGRIAFLASRETKGGGLLQRLKRVLRKQLGAIEKDRDFMRLIYTRSGLFFPSEGQDSGNLDPSRDTNRLSRTRGAFDLIAAGVAKAQERGEIRKDVDPYQVAEIYSAISFVTTRLWLTDYWDNNQRLDTRMLRAIDIMMTGLRPPPESER
jgi:AcrR family transcriptional regulator